MKTKQKFDPNHGVTAQAGFTLIELIVTVSIMAILMSLVLVNFGPSNQRRNLVAGRDQLVSELFYAQSSALSSKDVVAGQQPASAYGIVFNTSSSYQLVAVNNSTPPATKNFNTFKYPPNVSMKSISILKYDGTTVTPSAFSAYFMVPYARVALSYSVGGSTVSNELNDIATVTLTTADGQTTKTVIINGVVGNITAP